MEHHQNRHQDILQQLQPGEKISAMVQMKEFEEDKYLIMATKKGTIKKTPIMAYTNIRKSGIQAITLREDDELIDVTISDNNDNIMLITALLISLIPCLFFELIFKAIIPLSLKY